MLPPVTRSRLTLGLAVMGALAVVATLAPRADAARLPVRRTPPPPGVAPAIWSLLEDIDTRWPGRSKASDGIIGDAAHQARASDHNTGDALDVTHDANKGPDLDQLAERLLRDKRVTYVIWRRRIANQAIESGKWRPYTGVNPHDHHLHVSIKATERADASPWDVG